VVLLPGPSKINAARGGRRRESENAVYRTLDLAPVLHSPAVWTFCGAPCWTGELFLVRKCNRTAVCTLFSHQFGWDRRLLVSRELVLSEVPFDLLDPSAHDTGRYDTIKDLCRLEPIAAASAAGTFTGYSVLLTNDRRLLGDASIHRSRGHAFLPHERAYHLWRIGVWGRERVPPGP
jgi:hypothetical protein